MEDYHLETIYNEDGKPVVSLEVDPQFYTRMDRKEITQLETLLYQSTREKLSRMDERRLKDLRRHAGRTLGQISVL